MTLLENYIIMTIIYFVALFIAENSISGEFGKKAFKKKSKKEKIVDSIIGYFYMIVISFIPIVRDFMLCWLICIKVNENNEEFIKWYKS